MEFTNQGTLAQYLDKNYDKLQEIDILSIFQKLLIGYKESLFENDIIHRDLKLDNILIHNGIPKIADFGNSIFQNKGKEYLGESVVGSPIFSPPQNQGITYDDNNGYKYTNKYDIYSLGVILYFSLFKMGPSNPQNQQELAIYFKRLKQFGVRNVVEFPTRKLISQQTKEAIWSMLEFEEENRIDIESLLKHKMFEVLGLDLQFQQNDESDMGKSIFASRRNYNNDQLVMNRLDSNIVDQSKIEEKDKFFLFYRNISALCMINFVNLFQNIKLFKELFEIQEPQIDSLILCLAKMQTTILEFCYVFLNKGKVNTSKEKDQYFTSSIFFDTFQLINMEYQNSKRQLLSLQESIETKFARMISKGDLGKFEKEMQIVSSMISKEDIKMQELLIIYKNNLKENFTPKITQFLNKNQNQVKNSELFKIIHALLFVLSIGLNIQNYQQFNFEQFFSSLTRGQDYNIQQIKKLIDSLKL